MKKNVVSVILASCLSVIVIGCGKGADSGQTKDETAKPSGGPESASERTSLALDKISAFADVWSALYGQNEAAINAYEGVIMELVSPGGKFVSGVQYDLLNPQDADGRFEGKLILAGFPGFVEKSGSEIRFGYDFIRDKDGFGPKAKTGDRMVEDAFCDLRKGIYRTETFTERQGLKISRDYGEFLTTKDGAMVYLGTAGSSTSFRGEPEMSSSFVYIKSGKGQYDFVIGKGGHGPDFEKLSLRGKEDMSKDEARKMMEAAGYTLKSSGGIADGKLFVDAP